MGKLSTIWKWILLKWYKMLGYNDLCICSDHVRRGDVLRIKVDPNSEEYLSIKVLVLYGRLALVKEYEGDWKESIKEYLRKLKLP